MDINKDFLDGLNEDIRAKVAACRTPEDILALAKAEGVNLSDEQLDSVSGGAWDGDGSGCKDPYWHHV